jgi:hypothetical protein
MIFSSPADKTNTCKKTDLNLLLFISSLNTQLYGLEVDGMRTQQITWLKADLDAANNISLRNLKHTPWIIVFTHRPFYCSGDANCTEFRHKLRE